ncbi:hypothetical protein Tco_1210659 [Tanacetum coccineum]
MQEELNQFIANDVWELVPQPRNMTIIGTKWVFRNKLEKSLGTWQLCFFGEIKTKCAIGSNEVLWEWRGCQQDVYKAGGKVGWINDLVGCIVILQESMGAETGFGAGFGPDISQKVEKPSKKRQNRARDGKVCEDEAKSKSSQLREEKAKKNIT